MRKAEVVLRVCLQSCQVIVIQVRVLNTWHVIRILFSSKMHFVTKMHISAWCVWSRWSGTPTPVPPSFSHRIRQFPWPDRPRVGGTCPHAPCGYAIGLSVCLSHAASSKTVLLSADTTRGRDVKFRESRCQQTIFVSMEQSLLIYCYVWDKRI